MEPITEIITQLENIRDSIDELIEYYENKLDEVDDEQELTDCEIDRVLESFGIDKDELEDWLIYRDCGDPEITD